MFDVNKKKMNFKIFTSGLDGRWFFKFHRFDYRMHFGGNARLRPILNGPRTVFPSNSDAIEFELSICFNFVIGQSRDICHFFVKRFSKWFVLYQTMIDFLLQKFPLFLRPTLQRIAEWFTFFVDFQRIFWSVKTLLKRFFEVLNF